MKIPGQLSIEINRKAPDRGNDNVEPAGEWKKRIFRAVKLAR
jgi:hypothetical protein